MNCKQVQPNLLEYSRGLLNLHEAEAVRAHLADCAECRTVLEAELQLADRLSNAPSVSPQSDVWARIQSKIDSQPRRMRLLDFVHLSFARRIIATAGALAVLGTASLVFIPHNPAPPQASDEYARIAEAVAMMRVQPVAQQVSNTDFENSQDDPVGMTDDMLKVLQQEL